MKGRRTKRILYRRILNELHYDPVDGRDWDEAHLKEIVDYFKTQYKKAPEKDVEEAGEKAWKYAKENCLLGTEATHFGRSEFWESIL